MTETAICPHCLAPTDRDEYFECDLSCRPCSEKYYLEYYNQQPETAFEIMPTSKEILSAVVPHAD